MFLCKINICPVSSNNGIRTSLIDVVIKSLLQALGKYLSLYYLKSQNTYGIVVL